MQKINNPGFEILFEDNHLLVINKPAMLLSQEDDTGRPDVLTICKSYIKVKYEKPGDVYLGLVHRLDYEVSGVMVLARTSKAAARLSEQFRDRKAHKIYHATISGRMVPPDGELVDFLIKDAEARMARTGSKDSQEARLVYKTIKVMKHSSLLEVEPLTGRFHQIRFQVSRAGHPILGDSKYGSTENGPLALRAVRLRIEHPTLKKEMEFTIPGELIREVE